MKKTLLAAAIALTGLATFNTGHAQAVSGDLILGVEDTSGFSNENLMIDLGNFAGINNLDPLNISSDLSQVFGTNWASDTGLEYGIYSFNRGNNTIFMSQAATTPAGQSAQQNETSYANQNSTFGNLLVEFNGALNASLSGGGTTANGVFTLAADPTSWSSYAGINAGSVFNDSNINPIETTLGSGLDLYSNPLASPSTFGTFTGTTVTLGSNGVISAVPEPSTYVLFGLGALVLAMVVRRRTA